MTAVLQYGGVPVPYTVSWTGEERFFLAQCPHAQRLAICQPMARGAGKPCFGKPHSCRQRETIARGLCDLCGRSLAARTKISLSHARPQPHGAEGWAVLQVEPMLHRECAAICMRHCPSLKRDIASGGLNIRHVTRWRPQFAIMDEIYVASVTGDERRAIGHAKVELLQWTDRDEGWLST